MTGRSVVGFFSLAEYGRVCMVSIYFVGRFVDQYLLLRYCDKITEKKTFFVWSTLGVTEITARRRDKVE